METISTIVPAIASYYSGVIREKALPLLAHDKFGQIKDIPSNSSNVVKFRKYSALAAATTPLSEGNTPVGSSLSYTDITATVNQYGDYVTLSDFVLLTDIDQLLVETAVLLGEQAGLTLDTIIRDVLNAGTSVLRVNARSTRGAVISTDYIDTGTLDKAIRYLHNQNAPKITSMVSSDPGYETRPVDACYVGIVHPSVAYTLTGLTGFVPVEKYASKADLMDGEIGYYKEIRFIQTTNAKVFTGEGNGSIDVYSTLILGKNAYGSTSISGAALENIVKPIGSAGSADPLNQRGTSGWKASKAGIILQQLWMVRVESAIAA